MIFIQELIEKRKELNRRVIEHQHIMLDQAIKQETNEIMGGSGQGVGQPFDDVNTFMPPVQPDFMGMQGMPDPSQFMQPPMLPHMAQQNQLHMPLGIPPPEATMQLLSPSDIEKLIQAQQQGQLT